MGKRLIPVNKEEAKRLKKMLKLGKNTVEIKRIMIMINYLNGNNTDEVVKNMWVSKQTVLNTIYRYKEDKENFYKTKFTGRRPTKESIKRKEEIKNIIEERLKKWELIDIKDVEEEYKRRTGKEIKYKEVWRYIRKELKYNYQKPYVRDKRQPKEAEKIVKGRITKAIIKVWIEERIIDAESIKNKKTIFGGCI